uniref:Cytochrome c oxidase subunit 3 n=1 Tax=Pielomastax zhengi TaxID=997267 RepID=G8DZ98_9ORTH|nr:cytochrome c oxidase subunit III [Pielomastax zhengi]ADZ62107.1 cytochrome oxidase subunit III [Pielomastax zhengi]
MLTQNSNQPFHLVDFSPWPLTGAIGALVLTSGLNKWFHKFEMDMIMVGLLIMMMTTYQWWRDVAREGSNQGLHTSIVVNGLRWGMILFITSEILFFMSFFWAYFNSSLAPSMEIGLNWPPNGIQPFNPMQVPLLNTTILLSSGITVTWAHHSIMENNFSKTSKSILMTVILGIYFSALQAYEYMEAPFTIADAVYGSTFFMATGFHGLHVIIGTMFLFSCLLRHLLSQFSSTHHFGFEAAAWYWHFVDVVWLFLYVSIYWWGS